MNLLSYRSACALGFVALSVRAFGTAFIDSPELANAGWAGVLLAGTMYIPVLLSIYLIIHLDKEASPKELMTLCIGKRGMKAVALILSAGMLCESAAVSRLLMASILYGAQEIHITTVATLPSLIAAAIVACAGAGAIGGVAGIWIYFIPLLLAIIVGRHIPVYQANYLFPIWGSGFNAIFFGSTKILSAFTAFSALWMIQSGKQTAASQKVTYASPKVFLILFGVIVLVTAILSALASMLVPQSLSVPQSREYRLSMLLSNGLSPTFLQFPYVLLWYGSLMIAQGFALFSAAQLLTMAFPKLRFNLTVWGCALSAAILAAMHMADQNVAARIAPYISVMNSAPFIIAAIAVRFRKGGKHARF